MGIPLIHSELPAGLSSSRPAAGGDGDADDLVSLLDRRREVERALDRYAAVLDANGIDLTSPLVTRDGFPRQDVDVANVRIARTAIHRLRNDYKALDGAIELAMHDAFRSGRKVDLPLPTPREAFCTVNGVADGSPAQEAGLLPGDALLVFGRARASNHDVLRAMAREVAEAVTRGTAIDISLLRTDPSSSSSSSSTPEGKTTTTTTVKLSLRPNNTWGGRGAVGAHFLPI